MINPWGADGTVPQTHKSCLEKATHFLFIFSFLMLFKLQFCWPSITDSPGVPVKNTESLGLEHLEIIGLARIPGHYQVQKCLTVTF